jgi:cobalt-zinc-cadmium efflux system outer membrane protein
MRHGAPLLLALAAGCASGIDNHAVLVDPLPPVAMTTSTPAPTGGIDLAGLMRLAEEGSPTLEAARQRLAAAEGRRRQAGLWPNPRLEVLTENGRTGTTTSGARNPAGFEVDRTSVMLAQPIVLPRKYDARRAVGVADRLLREQETNAARHELYGAVHRAWVDVVYYGEALQLQFELVALANDIADAVAARADASPADVERARLEARRLDAGVLALVTARTVATEELRALVGGIDLSPTQVEGSLLRELPSAEIAVTRSAAIAENSAMLVANEQVRLARAALESARREWLPDIDVLVGGGYRNSDEETFAEAGFGLALPIFDRGQGRIAEAESNLAAALADRDATAQRLEAEIGTLFQLLSELDTLAHDYAVELVPQSRAVLEQARTGAATPLEVVDALRLYAATAQQGLAYRWQLNQAMARFRHFMQWGPEEAKGEG